MPGVNKPEEIILHHSLTEDGIVLKDADAIRRYHMQVKGWSDIGYHWIIESINGKLQWVKGREENISGAHCVEESMNFKSIGICVVGNYDVSFLSAEHVTMIKSKIKEICGRWKDINKVNGHREYATYKSCPGKNFDTTLFDIKELMTVAKKANEDLKFLLEHKPPIFDNGDYWQRMIDKDAKMSDVPVSYFLAAMKKIVERG